MNIHNHLNPSQINNTTPIKQGEATAATLKEKISDSKAVVIIRGQEYKVEFKNEIPQSEKVIIKVLNISENRIQVESKETLRNIINTQSNNSLQSIETAKLLSNPKNSDPISILMTKKGLHPDIAINNYIKEALSGKFDEHLNRLNKDVFVAIQNEVRVTTNAIKNETNLGSVVKQVNGTLNRISSFINQQTSEELSIISKELNVNLSQDKLQTVKDRLIRVLQRVEADIQESANEAGKERIVQVLQQIENELPDVSTIKSEPKEEVRQTGKQVQQAPNVTKIIKKNQEIIKSIPDESKSIEKLKREVQEAKLYQQLGREQQGKEKTIQTLQQFKNELSEISSNKSDVQIKEIIRNIREQVQNAPTVSMAIEKTQDLIKSIPFDTRALEKLEQVLQEAKHYQQLDRDQLGKEKIVQALQQIEIELTIKSELQLKETVRQIKEQVQQAPTVTKGVEKIQVMINSLPHARKLESAKSSLIENENISSQTEKNANLNTNSQQLNSKVTQAAELENKPMQNKSEITKQAVDQWINMIQKQSKMGQALDLLQNEINKFSDSTPVKKVMESMERAAQHVEAKKELASRKEIHETLQQIKTTLPSETNENYEAQSINEEVKSFIENSPLLASASKDIVVTKVTEKLAKATIDFKEVQREIVRNLNNVDNMLRSQHTQPQARQLLESTIAKLDNSILKSEMMILSDMGTEKKLMQASSQLAEAKKILSNGNTHEAQKIVQNVSKLLEKINWKPSEVKVMHYTKELSDEQQVTHYEKQLTKTISSIANYSDMEYGSPREMYEKIRSMGLNYERDIGNYFASNKPEHQLKDLESNNLKYLLQKISSEDGTGKFAQQIEQTLSNITGQQLLSKSDHQANQQSMMFSLPVQLEQQMKNIKVFVNSKKDGQKVDWENCSLYFLIETPKLGEVGILVSAADRKLSLTLKNNSFDFEQVAKPIGEKVIQKIEEIGYQVNGMKFTNLRKESAQQEDRKEVQQQTDFAEYFTEKGMNFTI